MKRKSTFLRMLALLALLLPWSLQAQNAKVSEYDGSSTTATYSSIVSTGTAQTFSGDYVDVQLPFAMYFGETQVPSGSTLRIQKNGSVTFQGIAALANAQIAPLYLSSGYTLTKVYTKNTNNQVFTVEWRKAVSGSNSYSFQMKLYASGDIEFCYGPMTISSSINVLVGMMSSNTDIYRVGGRNNGSEWDTIYRNTTGTNTRVLSTTYYPAYNETTGRGMVYTFTQPACVKPTSATATATAWNTIKVDWTVSSVGTGFQVKYSTNPDFNPSNEGESKNVTSGTDTTTNITGLQGGTTYYIYVRKNCSGTYSGWTQMTSATTPTGCPTLSGIHSSNITATGATIIWTSSLAASSYNVRYNLGDDFDPDENEGTLVTTTDTAKTLTGLTGASTYYYYVRANCVSGLATDWYGPYTFNTLCDAITVNADNPYTQTFSDGSMPLCWNEEVITGSTHWTFNSYYGTASFSYTPGASARLITPVFNLNPAGAYQVDFYHAEPDYQSGVDSLWLCYRTSTSGEWVRLAQYGSHSSTLESETVLLPNPSATYQLAFVSSAYDYMGMSIANVVVRTQPTCPKPSALAISETTGNSVTLSWNETGTATAWQIAYGLFTTEEDYTIIDATTNPFTVSGLGLGEWYFYVRSNCAANDQSDWVGGVSQNFGYCTPTVSGTDGTGLTHVVYGESMIVDNSLSNGTGYQNFSSMIGDGFRGSNVTVNLTYTTGNYPYGCKIWVDWNQDLDFDDDGELVYTGSSSYNHQAAINIPGAVALGDYRMRIGGRDGSTSISPCGDNSWQAFQDYTLRVIAAPSCFKPNALASSNVTATEATLTWTEAGLSTQWEVKYGPCGFDPNEEGYSVIVNTNPTVTLAYLEMSEPYDAYVRALCDPEGPTEWSTVCEFKTLCPSASEMQIGTAGTTSGDVATNSCYKYSWVEQIYTAAELGGAMMIDNISFEVTTSVAADRNVTIYLGETDKTAFTSTTDWIPANNLTQVYTGTMVTTSTGWQKIDFDTPFNYTGTGNLVIAIDDNTGSYKCTAQFRATSCDGNKAITIRSDNTNYDPNTTTYVGTLRALRTDIKIVLPCDKGDCNPPTMAIALSETEYAATLTFTDVNEETNPTYGIVYGPQGFDPTTAGTTVSPITTSTYTISNLAARTSYDVYVYAICSGSNGRMVKYNFVTPFIPNCKTPIIDGEYGASNITYNTATLTWRQPGDQPMFWTVRYADADFNPATAATTDYTELTVQGTAGATAQLSGLVAGTTYYVYIKATCSTAPDLDESPWLQMSNANPAYTFTTPTCVTPDGFIAKNVTNSTAWLKWDNVENVQGWTVRYSTDNTFATYTDVNVTVDSVKLTGLDAYTYYYAIVLANCTANDVSDWTDVINFRTTCPDGGDLVTGEQTGNNSYVPVYTLYDYSITEQIYTAEEMGVATSISSISYTITTTTNTIDRDPVYIYMANTDKTSFASTTDWVPASSMTLVYSGEMVTSETGSHTLPLNTPFEYDGTNLIVMVVNDDGAYNGTANFSVMVGNSQALRAYRDNDAYDVDNPGAGTILNVKNNFVFGANCNTDVTCFAPASVSTEVSNANVVTVNWTARTDLEPVVNNYEINYGLAGFNPDNQGAGTLVTGLNNLNTYNITAALESDADYDVYVRTVCGDGDYSKWTKGTFHTYPTCWAPSDLDVVSTTSNSATLSWTENTPTAATRWEVVYGLPGFNPDRANPIATTNNTAFVVDSLKHSTKYEFYVRAVCNLVTNDKSDWSAVATGTTQCGTWQYADMPLVENFDGVTGTTSSTINNHVLPNCWDYINTSTTTSGTSSTGYPGYPIAYNGASTSHSGNNHMRFYTYTTSAYGDQYAILPQFGFDLDTVVVGFYARESSTTASYVGNIVVGVMSDPENASTFVAVDTVNPTTTSYDYFEVNFEDYEGTARYIALKAPKPTTGYNVVYVDDLTVKLRERINTLADAGETKVVCNEIIMPDTTNGNSYHNGLNATYVLRPADAGKVAHITGDYDLEYGYDYLNVYRGGVNANNLVGRYTGTGTIDYMTTSNLWADSGYVTLVLTTDADNAFPKMGFKLLFNCEDPEAGEDVYETLEANGSFTWRNNETYTNNIVRTGLTYDPNDHPSPDMDRPYDAEYTYVNVNGVDSVTYHMTLTLHPSYSLTYNAAICQREEFTFYGNTYNATGTYTVPMQSQYGADSVGILNLQVNPAPSAAIYNGGNAVTEITGHCDNADLTLLARSNDNTATFVWEDSSTAASRVVNPHVTGTYTVTAANPTTGCTSLPASVTVTTTPVPALTINGDAEICYGQSATLTLTDANEVPATYRWSNGATTTSITVNPTQTTTYTVTATTSNASACTATAEFTVTVNPLPVVTATASVSEICRDSAVTLTATEVAGYSYSWNTGATTPRTVATATATGAYTVTVTDLKGCVNEFQTASVTVNPSYEVTTEMSVCYTYNPYTWENMTITTNGNYDQMLTTRDGHACDSLVHLAFTFQEMGIENSSIERCYGSTYTFENITRTATVDTNLTYVDNSGECPVQYNLAVKVNPVKASNVQQVVCDTYTWPVSGMTYTATGDYPVTLATSKGCDSVVTLNLTVNYQNTGVETVTACDSYVWDLNGVNYTASTNEPTFTLKNQWSCDSVVTLDLTVNYRSYVEDFHCVRDAYDYTWINGNTYDLDVEIADGIEYVLPGISNAAGCDSIAQLHLVMNPAIDSLNWATVEACDEYEIANAVVFNNDDDCQGHIEPLYLRESGDYVVRTRAADGHDQVVRIYLTVSPSSYHTTIANECLPYTWSIDDFEVATITEEMVNGANPFTMSVNMADLGLVTVGCSSIEVLRLTPKYPSTETIEAAICQNGSWTAPDPYTYTVNGSDLNVGVNTQIYNAGSGDVNAAGCPLIKQVELTVTPIYSDSAEMSFCESEFVNDTLIVVNANNDKDSVVLTIPGALNEEPYVGTVEAEWHTALGCDSTVTIVYTVIPTLYANDTAVACYEFTWDINDKTYVYENGASQTDDVKSISKLTGCDIIATLHLTLKDTVRGYVNNKVCTSYEYNGVTYHTDKTFIEPYEGDMIISNGCDSVTYISFHIQQTELIDQYVVTNRPYTWQNGITYSQSVDNVYYDEPMEGDCGNVYTLHLNMVDSITICDNVFPYNTGINGITLDGGDAGENIWTNNDPNGNDTILYYNVNKTYDITEIKDTCDSYTWEGETYTASGEYHKNYTTVDGCDSVRNLNLTIRNSNAGTVNVTVCDSYTWSDGNDSTYTVSGVYTYTTQNVAGCDSVVTLNLTINKNNGVEIADTACDSYTWDRTDATYTVSGDYNKSFTDANGCEGDSVLHLTINESVEVNSVLVLNDAASYIYFEDNSNISRMYTAPYDGYITHLFQNQYGCDSLDHLHLVIPVIDDNDIVEIDTQACGTFTWSKTVYGLPWGNGHTYGWIPLSERQSHGMALYKDLTDNKYVYSYPTDTTFVEGVMTQVRVLHLNLLEATYSTETLNIPVSLGSYTIEGVDFLGHEANVTLTFTYADRGTDTVVENVGVGSVAYCNDYRTYTVNFVDNYDTTNVFVCTEDTAYEWNDVTYDISTPGQINFYFAQKENEGTLTELVHVLKVTKYPVSAETIVESVCDSYTWTDGNDSTYTESGTYVYNYIDSNSCAATMTLNLTVKHNTSMAYTGDSCDTYTWARNNQVYTASGNYIYSYTDTNNCAAADTLHLTIRNNTNMTLDTAVCVSYTWSEEDGGDGRVLDSSAVYTYSYTAANECPSVNTLILTINLPASTGTELVACDSAEWHDSVYYTSGTYYYEYNTAAGCASVDTLYLTIGTATHNSETVVQCDSYEWHSTTYTESGDYTYSYNNDDQCASVDTLHLTINVNTSTVHDTIAECDEYTWPVNNRLYTSTGDYTARTEDDNHCATTNTLHLTINKSNSYDSVLYVSDGSYRYTYQDGHQQLFGEGVYSLVENYTNVAGCDSALNITLNVGTAILGIDNIVNCNDYTWRNGVTYVWISAEERNAHPNDDSVLPLYKTSTGTYIYYNPTFTVQRENAFDSIYMLSLMLTRSAVGYDEVTLNISDREVTYGDSTFHFDTLADLHQDFVSTDKEFDVHFPAYMYCDSIITLTIHLVNNYQNVADDNDDICVTTDSYTWRNHTISTATSDYDNAHTYYVYDTLSTGIIEYIAVNQHPLAYATERRTACDSYDWNGTTYTESTSSATAYFPAGTVIDGRTLICDSTVTLILTINHNTSTTYEVDACDTYTWLTANGGNGETYTTSGTYTYDYNASAPGNCPSTNTLVLTVNYNTSASLTVDACDSFTWQTGNGNTYTSTTNPVDTILYNYNTEVGNCPSTDTLYLTIRHSSNQTLTKTACDSYTWTAEDKGNGETYTESGEYIYENTAVNGCDSNIILKLTINKNSGHKDVVEACDSMQWHGTWYYADNNTATYDYVDDNTCASTDTLNLTVKYATHNVENVVACQTYTWHDSIYNNTSVTGEVVYNDYVYNYINGEGCASADTLHLTLGGGRNFGTMTVSNCGPYTWIVNDSTIGVIDESVQTSTSFVNPRTGCDSVVFLNLTIFEAPVTDITVEICDNELPYTWTDGDNITVFTEAGEAKVTYPFSANCDSTVHFTLIVNPTKVTNITDQVCLGNGYNENGFEIDAAELPVAGEYKFTLVLATTKGCDSTINLTLSVGDVINNPVADTACDIYTWMAGDGESYTYTESGTYMSGAYANIQGCTTVDVLTLTINVNASTAYTQNVCESYIWNGTLYTETGDYTYDYIDGNGCASTDTLHLTVSGSAINTFEVTACDKYTWETGDGQTYTTSGVYTHQYTTTAGCNGIDYLVLTINYNTSTEYTETACDSYTWNNTEYSVSGDYEYEYEAGNGCPSKDVLHLTVNTTTYSEESATACNIYTWHGNNYIASGDYTYTTNNVAGCDSIITLHLTINTPVVVTIDTTVCDSFVWNGISYDNSDVISHTYTGVNGCDSTEIINLTVNTTTVTFEYVTACDSYTWAVNGETYTQGGTKFAFIDGGNIYGCDSVAALSLTLNYNTNSAETVEACDSYTWHDVAYTTSGTYTYAYTPTSGCPSVDTLYLTVNNSTTGSVTAEACNYFIWNGTAYNQSGDYNKTFTAANGCDSVVTLHLTINTQVSSSFTAQACQSYTWNGAVYTATGSYTQNFTSVAGCDSIVTLNLTISPALTSSFDMTQCGSYTWEGVTYTVSGSYQHTYTAFSGCDSIVTLNLTITPAYTSSFNVTECGSHTWNDIEYTTSGTYTHTYTTGANCDSIVTLNLTINQPVTNTLTVNTCGSYIWEGTTYTQSGNYTHTYTGAATNGCDSIVTLALTIGENAYSSFYATSCDSYVWEGVTYTVSGDYTHTYSAYGGCDSIVTLHLTINPTVTNNINVSACDTYTWDGDTYTTSGIYTHTYTSAVTGCDSIVNLALTISNAVTNTVSETVCDSYTWNDVEYTTSGVYTHTYTPAEGCDSIVTLVLTVYHSANTTVDVDACESYTWIDGVTYTESTNTPTFSLYTINGCDSIVTLNLTINHATTAIDEEVACDGFVWIDGVNYTASTNEPTYTLTGSNGCDSVVTLHLTINHSVEIYETLNLSQDELPYDFRGNFIQAAGEYVFYANTVNGCDSTVYLTVNVNIIGIDDVVSFDDLKVYPNPTRGQVTVSAENVVKVEVLDIVGRLVATFENTNIFDLSDLAEGAYTLRITLTNGTTVRRVVKK